MSYQVSKFAYLHAINNFIAWVFRALKPIQRPFISQQMLMTNDFINETSVIVPTQLFLFKNIMGHIINYNISLLKDIWSE